MFDPSIPAHERASQRLDAAIVVWLTTVDEGGLPMPSPVWFWWDGEGFLIFSREGKPKLRNLARNPAVALHLDGDGEGGENVIVEGVARLAPDAPPADQVVPYVEKYRGEMASLGWTPEEFAASYPVVVRVVPTRVRVW